MGTTYLGLDEAKAKKVADRLNDLLAAYQVYYMNLRGYHWNLKGEKFFEMHEKFEAFYDDAKMRIDEVAERVVTVGFMPDHTYSTFLEKSDIKEHPNVTDPAEAVKMILKGIRKLVEIERDILKLGEEAGDEGTVDMMGSYINENEKLAWMLNAYLS